MRSARLYKHRTGFLLFCPSPRIFSSFLVTLPPAFWDGFTWIMKNLPSLSEEKESMGKEGLKTPAWESGWVLNSLWAHNPEIVLSEVPWSFFPEDNKGSLFIGFCCYEVTILRSEAVSLSYTFLCGHNLVPHSGRSAAAGQGTGPAEIVPWGSLLLF